jgi:hypothetical protein
MRSGAEAGADDGGERANCVEKWSDSVLCDTVPNAPFHVGRISHKKLKKQYLQRNL